MSEHPPPPGRLAGKVALVTGAASGIGRAVAELFVREGARVALADLADELVRGVAGSLPEAQACALALDVTSEPAWEAAVTAVLARWGRLDILINNAGISFGQPLTETSLADWRRVMAVNLDGVFLGLKHGGAALRRGGGGSIVNVASASGIKPAPGAAAYCASKAGVRMLSRTAALEFASAGIRVNSVSPSGVTTPLWESMPFFAEMAAKLGGTAAVWAELSKDVPLRRFADAGEIAQGILYLASDESRFVTAADLALDGGYTA
ncbi:MAG: glucose 1-dehydrogenase [Verrucomicrobia bacterium]|nr:glucose 1-dehydrogenase [Verrucomicrobiota bacterium]